MLNPFFMEENMKKKLWNSIRKFLDALFMRAEFALVWTLPI